MKRIGMTMLFLAMLLPAVSAQTVAPPAVVKSATAAVEELGKKVVNSDYKAAIDSMYPQWKARMAKRKGGMKKLEEELAGIGEYMARNGVQIISFKVSGAPKAYEVWPGDRADAAEGAINYTKWLLLIPTVTQFRIFHDESPKGSVINTHGFQVAIADKGQDNWTFIDGSDLSVSDLRSLFITLPANMELPPVKREEAE
ncbi:hypothetical protein ACFQY0_06335 [Haloferula chungangensis]|uniref:Uncharacterized protein n=1 Tax=Haloferula chungangensis TaxID=1048331 RepID=A0ABW2L396_9BACT